MEVLINVFYFVDNAAVPYLLLMSDWNSISFSLMIPDFP